MTDYYDSILVAIPVALFGIAGVVSAVGYSATAGVSFGALVAASVMGHAMFVNAPVTDMRAGEQSADGTREEVTA